ncbi:Thioredoxin reductase [Singulisphaera sp. GP187]|uniref:NAD(P)/FAD-dependent oxidoreductase n=1 Tax=Singulisphaera sp. GP187 TaxID=1882752 RepID=UPI00092ACBD6|nr:NAD(P)/FAD-dependent oxidoreductase [Singulisphaera sp. GP187]SIO64919.1 Thioredoxin reductase [Singulisphaera sp. GP187]
MTNEKIGTDDGAMTRRHALATVASAGVLLGAVPAVAREEGPMAGSSRRFDRYDVVVVGGGPAGLSAALVLGRACLEVLVCDSGKGRNAPAAGVHGFLTQDGTPPAELRRIGREQLRPYEVDFHEGAVVDARKTEGGFEITLENAQVVACRKLILATGMVDVLPEIPGLRELWGTGVIHCPYCHGWEHRGQPWAVLVPPEEAVEASTLLLGWSPHLTLLTNGPSRLTPKDQAWLKEHAVEVVEGRVERLEGDGGRLRAIRLEDGRRLEREVLFVRTQLRQSTDLPKRLNCALVADGPKAGMVRTDPFGATSVEGLYVVGDASDAGVPSVASAVAEGSIAAAGASRTFFTEDARRPAGDGPVRRK